MASGTAKTEIAVMQDQMKEALSRDRLAITTAYFIAGTYMAEKKMHQHKNRVKSGKPSRIREKQQKDTLDEGIMARLRSAKLAVKEGTRHRLTHQTIANIVEDPRLFHKCLKRLKEKLGMGSIINHPRLRASAVDVLLKLHKVFSAYADLPQMAYPMSFRNYCKLEDLENDSEAIISLVRVVQDLHSRAIINLKSKTEATIPAKAEDPREPEASNKENGVKEQRCDDNEQVTSGWSSEQTFDKIGASEGPLTKMFRVDENLNMDTSV